MRLAFLTILTLGLVSCKKENIDSTCESIPSQVIAPCNEPVDTAFTDVQVFDYQSINSPNSNFRIVFSEPIFSGFFWEATFVNELHVL